MAFLRDRDSGTTDRWSDITFLDLLDPLKSAQNRINRGKPEELRWYIYSILNLPNPNTLESRDEEHQQEIKIGTRSVVSLTSYIHVSFNFYIDAKSDLSFSITGKNHRRPRLSLNKFGINMWCHFRLCTIIGAITILQIVIKCWFCRGASPSSAEMSG